MTVVFVLDLSQQLVYLPSGIDAHEPAERSPPLPTNRTLGRLRESLHAADADPHVPLRLQALRSGNVLPDVPVGKVS